MSTVKFLLPQVDEMSATDVLALQERKTVFPFNLSAKTIKVTPDMELAEKYPFSIESSTGFTYQIVRDGKKIAEIQLSDQKGISITGDAKYEKLLKYFFMDETKTLYRSLINQLTKLGNNQLFILCLGMKAQSLVKGDVTTVSMIKAPELNIITGDQWIDLVVQVVKDISWGFFDSADRLTIAANFERELRDVIDVELKMLGVNIPALEKAVSRTLKQITGAITETANTEDIPDTGVTLEAEVTQSGESVVDDTPTAAFLTEEQVTALGYEELLKTIEEVSKTLTEYIKEKKITTKSQLVKMLTKRDYIIPVEVVEAATEPETQA